MPALRACEERDLPAMALIRATEWGEVSYWQARISGYLEGKLSPHLALPPRACYVAVEEQALVGFVAGHLTRRFACEGEVQWINVSPEWRRRNIASALLRCLMSWFLEKGALCVCVNADPGSRVFYRQHGAEDMKAHWLVWKDIRAVFGRSQQPDQTLRGSA